MTKKRRKEALSAFSKYIETEWMKPGTTISDLWLAAVEWADNNLSDVCSTTGLGGIPIGRRPICKNSKTGN